MAVVTPKKNPEPWRTIRESHLSIEALNMNWDAEGEYTYALGMKMVFNEKWARITDIIPYMESGPMGNYPWFAICVGDQQEVAMRINSLHVDLIKYFKQETEEESR